MDFELIFQILAVVYPVLFALLALALGGGRNNEEIDDFSSYSASAASKEEREKKIRRGAYRERARGGFLTMAAVQLVFSGGLYFIEKELVGCILQTTIFITLLTMQFALLAAFRKRQSRPPLYGEPTQTATQYTAPPQPRWEETERKSAFQTLREQAEQITTAQQNLEKHLRGGQNTEHRPTGTFSSDIGTGGRFPIGSVRGYKIQLYVVHVVAYFLGFAIGSGLMFFGGFLMYKMVIAYNKNVSLDRLSPTDQQEFIDYAQSIRGIGYVVRIAIPAFLLQSMITIAIVVIVLFANLGGEFIKMFNLFL